MRENSALKEKKYYVHAFFLLGTLLLRVFYISKVQGPFVYADEFGYWSHAAHMAGHTWAGVMNNMSWYSFGYSFILAPTFFLSNHMDVLYKAAVLFNVIMCLFIYCLAFLTIRRILPNQGTFVQGVTAFTATSFSTYIFYSYVTLSETVITLLVWLVFYEVILIEERSIWWKGFLLGITLGYAYMVHNRLLAVIGAAVFCMILLLLQRKTDWKCIFSMLVSIAVVFIVYTILKDYFRNMIIHNEVLSGTGIPMEMAAANSIGGQIDKVKKLFTGDGILKLILNCIGQIWECLSATYLLAGMGIVYGVYEFWQRIRSKQLISVYFYPVIAFSFSVAITSVFFSQYVPHNVNGRHRIDPFFYGRYNECMLGMLILLGLCFLMNTYQCKKKIYLGIMICYFIGSIIVLLRVGDIENPYLNVVSAVGIHIFHWLGEFSVWKCVAIALVAAVFVFVLSCFKWPKLLNYYFICLMLLCLFFTTAFHCMRICIRGENDNTARYTAIFDYLNKSAEKDELVYICADRKMAYDTQTRVVDKVIVNISTEESEQIAPERYLVIERKAVDQLALEQYIVCLEQEEFMILQKIE